ncbi:MAG: acetylxylan esterase [Prevotella sp.]|nr:acetylxylan esterase [Prevotella sp.]
MKKILLSLIWCLISVVSLAVENYPYRSDYLWVTVPDHADWIYKAGEQATVEVQFYKYGIPRDGIVEYGIGNDLMPDDTSGKAELRNGRCTIKMGTVSQPCFRDLRLRLKLDGTTYQHHVKVGFSPEKIRPYTQQPKDFRQFWDEALKEAKKYPLKYTRELQPELSNEKTDCYLIRLELNRQHQVFYGYLMMPKQAKPGSCPVVLSPPGAGIKRIKDPNSRDYYPENGVIRLITEIHGMDPRMPEQYFENIRASFDGKVKGYLYQGIDNRDNYYMKHVYLGLVRCIDLLTSLPEWDGRNVITVGGSQGGALAIIAAALDERINLCVANHPALSDMSAAVEPGRAHGYPHFSAADGMLTANHLKTLAYYDVVNFAPYVKAKTYLTWGFNDNTCPPTTSYAVWNLLQCEKESLITPVNEHWTSEVTNRQQLDWILKNLK